MLSLLVVQILAACSFAGAMGAIVLGGVPRGVSGRRGRVVAKRTTGRWADVTWGVGTALSVLWPIAVLAVPEVAYHWPPSPDIPASGAFQLLGFLAAITGGILFVSAGRALGRHLTPAIQVQEGHQLVQEGPYRYIRHPLYTAIVTSAGGWSLLFLSPILALVTLVLAGMAVYRARLEEELLSSPEGLGRAYSEYMARTGRFLPRIVRRSSLRGPS